MLIDLSPTKRDLDSYSREYVTVPFETIMVKVRKSILLNFLRKNRFRNILEVGCGGDSLFESLDDFSSFTTLEPCDYFFERAQTEARGHKCADRIQIFKQYFDDFKGDASIDCIVISSLLHEIEDPVAMLHHAYDIAPKGCSIHINVPNAKSFHRLWAVEAGLIKNEYQRSGNQIRLQQYHTFDLDGLKNLVQQCGFTVVESGSYFIKPFDHAQMQQLTDMGVLTDELIAGLMKMERHVPGLGADIFVHISK